MLKQFPRKHLAAACGLVAIAAFGLILSPSGEVEAQRVSVALDIESGILNHPVTAEAQPRQAAEVADNRERPVKSEHSFKKEVVEIALADEANSQSAASTVGSEAPTRDADIVTVQDAPAEIVNESATAAQPIAAVKTPAPQRSIDIPPELDWQTFKVSSGDTLSTLFRKAGFNDALMYKVIKGEGKQLARLYKGNEVRFGTRKGKLQEVLLVRSRTESLRTQLTDTGFVTQEVVREPEAEFAFATGEIENSLFLAAKEAGLSSGVTMELANIFGWDIDFIYDIRKGDKFDVLYETLHLDGEEIGDGRILAANFINQGRKITAILYTNEAGKTAFYSPDGKSVQKAFLRAPIDARISSSFNLQRRHPILNVVRPHQGTDYAAAPGSPIMAAGDGRVRFKGWKGGYGRTVEIQHGDGITTLYAHLKGFARNIAPGKSVKQGQTIGYVGSSGMATGPHLHYEFRMNGTPRNSRTVKLPDAVPVPKQEMAKFKAHAEKLVARLDSRLKETQLALAKEQ